MNEPFDWEALRKRKEAKCESSDRFNHEAVLERMLKVARQIKRQGGINKAYRSCCKTGKPLC